MKSVKLIPNIRLSYTPIIVAFAFLLLCSLSFWQLQRGLQKQALLHHSIQQTQLPAMKASELSAISKNPRLYLNRQIKLQGFFDHRKTILLDNQINTKQIGHPIGYHLITPLVISPTQSILVNRGWIPIGTSRAIVPPVLIESIDKNIINITNIITITGHIQQPKNNRFIKNKLNADPFNKDNTASHYFTPPFPLRVQAIDVAQLQTVLNTSVLDFIINLSPTSVFSFEGIPEQAIWLTPEKHFAYALQWLLLAFSLLIIYYIVNAKLKTLKNIQNI